MAETILIASAVHTHDPEVEGNAIALSGGRIVAVGMADDLRAAHPRAEVDSRYGEAVILPGFVEAHSHSIAGGIWAYTYVGYFDQRDPDGRVWPGCRTLGDVIDRLRDAEAQLSSPSEPLRAWGLDPIYFPGERLVASHLDVVSRTRPIFVAHASLHLATVNTALMEEQGIDADTLIDGVPKDGNGNPIGELQEPAAMRLAGQALTGFFRPLIGVEGLVAFGNLARNAGVTTVADLGTGSVANDGTVGLWHEVVHADTFPARVSVFHNPGQGGPTDPAEIADLVLRRRGESTEKLRFGGVKFVIDGSIQGFTARLSEPYLGDRPNGLWLVAPEQLRSWMTPVLDAGLLLHVHCNGDQAVDVMLDAFTDWADGTPPPDHRTTIQHCQLTRPDQYERMAGLGMAANLFSNHLWYWGDQHVDITVGPDRAARMNAAATVLANGISLALHCDAPVTPLGSLHVAWCAVNRTTPSGRVVGPEERVSVSDALYAITMGAAHQLRMESEIGSITPGKRADFVVLDADPHQVDPSDLREISVLGTVLGGRHHLLA